MNGFRRINLQRSVSMFILFTALFSQIHTVYACDSMENMPKQVCCCGEHVSINCSMGDSCAMHEQAAENQCCEVSYETLNDASMLQITSTVDYLTLLLDCPQPPPFLDSQPPASLLMLSQLSISPYETIPLKDGKQTYLTTRRLRL